MRDMVPHGERSIRNIPISANHRRLSAQTGAARPSDGRREFPGEDVTARRRRRGSRRLFWVIALIVAGLSALAALLLSTVFAGASVVVHPRVETVVAPATLEATLNPPTGTLAYKIMTVQRTAATTVAASGTARVSRQASGVITVYNAYSEGEQRLIANTRFEAPDGKIYRVRDSIVVPGATTNADGSLKPGEVSATVYADSPGADYNREGPTRFTIPGFRGDPRYEKFHGESLGPMTGGFVGEEPAVPPAELARAEAALKLELETGIRTAAAAELPPGYLPVAGTLTVSYGDIRKVSKGSRAELSQNALAAAAILRASDLAQAIARETVEGYGGEALAFLDLSRVSLTGTSLEDGVLTVSLGDSYDLIWQYDAEALRQALVGRERSALADILESFAPAVVAADATLRPFWQSTFPSDPGKIKVTTAPQAAAR